MLGVAVDVIRRDKIGRSGHTFAHLHGAKLRAQLVAGNGGHPGAKEKGRCVAAVGRCERSVLRESQRHRIVDRDLVSAVVEDAVAAAHYQTFACTPGESKPWSPV